MLAHRRPGATQHPAQRRSTFGSDPDDPHVEDIGVVPNLDCYGVRHLVVHGEKHQGVISRRRSGQSHRTDVDIRLAQDEADPAHSSGLVLMTSHHHEGRRRHVEPVVVDADRRGSPLAMVPARTALPASPSTVKVTRDAKVPASLVLRSLTVRPRFLARNPALMRLTRSEVASERTPRSAAAVSCDASWLASSPATSTVSVLTPPRRY